MFTDFLKRSWDTECMGCGIASKQVIAPYGIILETEHFVLHQDPLIRHIRHKRHIQSIREMGENEYQNYCEIIRKIHILYPKCDDFLNLTLIQEESSKHFHLWFFPWDFWMGISEEKPKLSQIRDIMRKIAQNEIENKNLQKIRQFIVDFHRLLNDT